MGCELCGWGVDSVGRVWSLWSGCGACGRGVEPVVGVWTLLSGFGARRTRSTREGEGPGPTRPPPQPVWGSVGPCIARLASLVEARPRDSCWRGTPVLAQRVHLWDGLLLEEGLKPGFWAAGHLQPKVAGRAGLRVAHNWCPRAWAVLPAQSCGRATPRHSTWTSARQCHCGPV